MSSLYQSEYVLKALDSLIKDTEAEIEQIEELYLISAKLELRQQLFRDTLTPEEKAKLDEARGAGARSKELEQRLEKLRRKKESLTSGKQDNLP